MSIRDLRTDYQRGALDEADAGSDPLALFARWFDEARGANVREANAMTLSTVDAQGQPTARIVLLKGVEAGRFVFFTNYQSRKASELAARPDACLLFFWAELERQVRIEGRVEKTTAAESDAYFAVRPLASRLGAWASPQSQVIAGRPELERRFAEAEARFADVPDGPPRPPHWGGYQLTPAAIEFWQGRSSRLHDRLLFRHDGSLWRRERLAP
jgi:pyridoxamine 5'-phosphate oxidase